MNQWRLDATKIDLLIQQWLNEREQEHATLLTKTDVLALFKKKLIARDRALQELDLLGYNSERAGLLLATVGE